MRAMRAFWGWTGRQYALPLLVRPGGRQRSRQPCALAAGRRGRRSGPRRAAGSAITAASTPGPVPCNWSAPAATCKPPRPPLDTPTRAARQVRRATRRCVCVGCAVAVVHRGPGGDAVAAAARCGRAARCVAACLAVVSHPSVTRPAGRAGVPPAGSGWTVALNVARGGGRTLRRSVARRLARGCGCCVPAARPRRSSRMQSPRFARRAAAGPRPAADRIRRRPTRRGPGCRRGCGR